MFFRRCQWKHLFERLGEAVELLVGVVCQEELPDKGQEAIDADSGL
jgi:hypothetical protein